MPTVAPFDAPSETLPPVAPSLSVMAETPLSLASARLIVKVSVEVEPSSEVARTVTLCEVSVS